ncbi:uncharacterized protein LOC120012513 [Tripterygium wilfordii]|uniref:uncharacterized protein LOC120012513 n=1 Tax=Tripterygium wilfordii TaxID=458696 RepID=UPI0018F8624F|nr:uncharacterized protein LOC120012513 [Tripterygium wilfordii]
MGRFWGSLQEALGAQLDFTTPYHPQSDGQSERTIQILEDMLPLCWAEVGEKVVSGPEMVKEARDGIEKIRKRLITAQSKQKSYTDKRRKPLEFAVGDKVFLKVSPRRSIQRYSKQGKLAPRGGRWELYSSSDEDLGSKGQGHMIKYHTVDKGVTVRTVLKVIWTVLEETKTGLASSVIWECAIKISSGVV